jgi:hypothetical protein
VALVREEKVRRRNERACRARGPCSPGRLIVLFTGHGNIVGLKRQGLSTSIGISLESLHWYEMVKSANAIKAQSPSPLLCSLAWQERGVKATMASVRLADRSIIASESESDVLGRDRCEIISSWPLEGISTQPSPLSSTISASQSTFTAQASHRRRSHQHDVYQTDQHCRTLRSRSIRLSRARPSTPKASRRRHLYVPHPSSNTDHPL